MPNKSNIPPPPPSPEWYCNKVLSLWWLTVPEEDDEYGEDGLDDDGEEEDEGEGVGQGEAPGTGGGQAHQAQDQQHNA